MDVNKKHHYGIQIILLSHSFFWVAFNLLAPFLSIFLINEIKGATLNEVGISSLIYFLSFGVFLPVIGFIEDKIKGLKDEITFSVAGYLLRAFLLISLSFANSVWHLYMIQFFLGFSRALASPSDKVLYTKFLSWKSKATFWALDESLVNISAAIGAGIGGYIAQSYNFRILLFVAGGLTFVAALINMYIFRLIKE